MSTKIGSHRIEDHSITKQHLEVGMKFAEGSELTLNHPTHSNANDLNRDQLLSLTQMGFADHLHKHAGGGGGDAGIYTNKQRDSMLLDLMMLIASQAYRLENSLMDEFDDASGIFLGLKPPAVTTIEEIFSDTDNASLEPSVRYAYRISQKFDNKPTEASLPVMKTTTDLLTSPYRKMRLLITLDPRNEGVKIWRAKAVDALLAIPFSAYSDISSNTQIPYNIIPGENVNAGSTLLIEYIGSGGTTKDMGSAASGAVAVGALINQTHFLAQNEDIIFGFRNANDTFPVHELCLSFGFNPAEIPLNFEMYYSQQAMPDHTKEDGWLPLNCKYKDETVHTGVLSSGKVEGNTTQNLSFSFNKITITGIKIVITKHLGAFMYTSLRCFHKSSHVGEYLTHKLNTGLFNMTNAKTLIVDVKADEDHSKYAIGFRNKGEIESNTTLYDNAIRSDYSNQKPNYMEGNSNRVIRTTIPAGTIPIGTNKVRLRFTTPANLSTIIGNVSFAFTDEINARITYPESLVPVTFNNGDLIGRNNLTDTIESDWITIPIMTKSPTHYVITLKLMDGRIHTFNSSSSIWYKNGDDSVLYDTSGIPFSSNVLHTMWSLSMRLETGKSYKGLNLPSLPVKNRNKWWRHYIDLSTVKSQFTTVDRLLYILIGIAMNGQVNLSNIKFSDSEVYTDTKRANITATATSTNGVNTVDKAWNKVNTNYWESNLIPTMVANERFMFKFPEMVTLDMLRFYEEENDPSFGFEQYFFQTSTDPTAVVTDSNDSPKWQTINTLSYFLDQATNPNVGSITAGLVENSNLFSEGITHVFQPTEMLSLRMVIMKTRGNTRARLRDFSLYTSETPQQYDLMYESNEKEDELFEFIDNQILGTPQDPNLINYTGSDNIVYDSTLELIKVYDKTREATFLSNVVLTTNFSKILLRSQVIDDNNSMTYEVSNDGGITFTEVMLGDVVQLPSIGNQFVLRVHMSGQDKLSAYSMLYTL